MQTLEQKVDEILKYVRSKTLVRRDRVLSEIAQEHIDRKTPEFVMFIRDIVVDVIDNNPTAPSKEIADKISLAVCQNYGGGQLYLPQGIYAAIEGQHWEMYEKFNGSNYFDLAHEYGVSEVWVREVVKKCRRAHQDKLQHKLPGVN